MKPNKNNLDLDFDTAHSIWDNLPSLKAVVSWLAVLLLFTQIVFRFGEGDENRTITFFEKKTQIDIHSRLESTMPVLTVGQCSKHSSNSSTHGCRQTSSAPIPTNYPATSNPQELTIDSRYALPSNTEPSLYCTESATNATLIAGDDQENALLCRAHKAAMVPMAGKNPKLAFLFLVRDEIPFEPLWRRFFHGHEQSYSVYVHSSNSNHSYPNSSFFHGKTIQSRPVKRFSMTLVDAQRRLLAHALLDSANANAWFTFICEKALPVRNFPFVFNYITNSEASFVEAFAPRIGTLSRWSQEPEFARNQTRKGEAWMTLHRRHAGVVVGESRLYAKFDRDLVGAAHDESYIQTMLYVADACGIANRTVMYVNWSEKHHKSHPRLIEVKNVTQGAANLRKVQQQTRNEDDYFNDSRERGFDDNEPSCVYNGSPYSSCYIFARKFATGVDEVQALQKLPKEVLGY